jgi:eukaryotic-like serine/threonine-protein kinase
MPQQTPLLPGDPRRLGRYRLGGRIASLPSEDPTFIGIDPDGTEVAISLLRGDWARDAAARDRFAAEAAVAKRVPPFCAARVLDAGLDPSGAYLVSEHIPGPSLLEVVAADGTRRGQDLEAVAIAMATGLASVHQAGLVHGNFGPEYVIMARQGPPRVVEFGITPPYGAATPSADMLAWARTVVFAASGRPPATLDDLSVLPQQIRGAVQRCLDPEPAERPAARAVLLSLLGDAALTAGVLAEGARRGTRPAGSRPQSSRGRRDPADRPAGATGSRHSHGAAPADQRRRAREPARPAGRGRASGRRRAGWLIGAAAVVIAAAVVLYLVQGTRGGSATSGLPASADQAAHNSRSPSPSPSPSLSPSRGPLTPAAFAGSWTGLVRQPPADTYHVSVGFTAGATSGTISYSGTDFSCSGALSLVTATPTRLTLSQGIVRGQSKCANGHVAITLTGPNTIHFSFRSSGPVASGTLGRS